MRPTLADLIDAASSWLTTTAWCRRAQTLSPSGFTGVFLHEFTHTRQVAGMRDRIGPIDSTWPYPEELDDDAVQTHFGADADYVAAYTSERDLLYRAAGADSLAEARALAAEALATMRSRHARWFTGDKAVFAEVDDIFLSMEGIAQWSAYAWLAHPDGGGLERDAAVKKMLGRRRWWAQDAGLALLLVVDRLLPEWPAFAFSVPAPGATELLERAVGHKGAALDALEGQPVTSDAAGDHARPDRSNSIAAPLVLFDRGEPSIDLKCPWETAKRGSPGSLR